jgi:uncharacterized membrane protein YhaH (DUF805 family)
MFTFHGYMGRQQFLLASALRIGLFLATIVGFPFLVRALATASRCSADTCGALGLVTAVAVKPLAFIVFVFSFVGISVRRARDAGVPGWIGLFIPLLFALDHNFFVFAGAPWSFAFSAGALHVSGPRHAPLALACIVALCVLPSRRDGPGSRNPFGYAGLAAFGLGLVIAVIGVIASAMSTPAVMVAWRPLIRVVAPHLAAIMTYVPYLMVCLTVLLAWIVWRGFGHVAVVPQSSLPEPAAQSDIPTKKLAALAFALAIVAFAAVMQSQHGAGLFWVGLFTQLTPIILPTALLYFCLMLTAFLVVKRRTVTSVVLLVLAILPFAHWAYADRVTSTAQRQEAAEIAAIPTTPAARVPAAMVIEFRSTPDLRAIWSVKGIEHVILVGSFGRTKLQQFDRPPARGRQAPPREVASLPYEYLLLRSGTASHFAKRGHIYGPAGGPLELRFVDMERSELVGIWYRSFNPRPAFPPLLTMAGWFRGSNSATTDEVNASLQAFLTRSFEHSSRKAAAGSD